MCQACEIKARNQKEKVPVKTQVQRQQNYTNLRDTSWCTCLPEQKAPKVEIPVKQAPKKTKIHTTPWCTCLAEQNALIAVCTCGFQNFKKKPKVPKVFVPSYQTNETKPVIRRLLSNDYSTTWYREHVEWEDAKLRERTELERMVRSKAYGKPKPERLDCLDVESKFQLSRFKKIPSQVDCWNREYIAASSKPKPDPCKLYKEVCPCNVKRLPFIAVY